MKRRLLLIGQPNLLRDSLENTLSHLDDVQLTGCLSLDDPVLAHCSARPHDLVLIADDQSSAQQASTVMAGLLEAYPTLPIIRVNLDANVLRIYSSETLPARVVDLLKVIHQVPLSEI